MKELFEDLCLPWKFMRNLIVTLLLLLVVMTGISMFTYTVNEKEAAVVYQMGQIVAVEEEPGIHGVLPFIRNVSFFPMSIQELDVSKSEVLTLDKKNYVIDTYVVWRIADLETFVRTAKNIGNAEELLDSTVYGITKRVMGQHSQDALIGVGDGDRNVVNTEITRSTNETAAQYGIEVLDVKIKALDVPAENESAIYDRMISERNQSAETYTAAGELSKSLLVNEADKEVAIIKAEAEKTAEQLKGEAEAEYMRIWAEAYNTPEKVEFYEFVRSLEALEVALSGENGKTLILDAQSPLAEIINGK